MQEAGAQTRVHAMARTSATAATRVTAAGWRHVPRTMQRSLNCGMGRAGRGDDVRVEWRAAHTT